MYTQTHLFHRERNITFSISFETKTVLEAVQFIVRQTFLFLTSS